MRQHCRREHQKEQRENGHYALSLGFPKAGETNDKSGVLHNFPPKVGTKTYRIVSPSQWYGGQRVGELPVSIATFPEIPFQA
jgi:hypothetical protein